MSYLEEASSRTPDPQRSLKNLKTFIQTNPEYEDTLKEYIDEVAHLFAYSQFLANFSSNKPDVLFRSVRSFKKIESRQEILDELNTRLNNCGCDEALTIFREFRKEQMIKITVRDIMDHSDTVESMEQMSDLADAIISVAHDYIKRTLSKKFGMPDEYSFAVFALGKLGAQELNYSSDVDLIFVYGSERGQTSGIQGPTGAIINSIDNHEFYCKLTAEIGKFLSQNTADGFVYRVDMRLRPDGQRGDSALSLRSYELYYESWGREWERLALIRARFVCGDEQLGKDFIDMINPFLWRKYIDYSTIDEIRSLKTKIDATFKKDDIKRGYGGIREIEFFIQSMQLIYGGKEPMLKQRRTLIALHMLNQKEHIGEDDHKLLSDNYIYLRRVEHYIQMLNDVQTHTVPMDKDQREALARKLQFRDYDEFSTDLQKRRLKIRETYNLLFGRSEDDKPMEPSSIIFDGEIGDDELNEYLRSRDIVDTSTSTQLIKNIKEELSVTHSLKGRRIMGIVIPRMVEKAISTAAPENALRNIVQFIGVLSVNEPYLETFMENKVLSDALIGVFSQSDYISKMILGNPEYIDVLSGGTTRRKTLATMKKELRGMTGSGMPLNHAIRVFKKSEEIRLGTMFLNRQIGTGQLVKGLTKVAEAIVDIAIVETCKELDVPAGSFVQVVAMGKFGGREITIGSDLDILFYVTEELEDVCFKTAERFLRVLQAYTKDGIAYRVDTRLRPDGSKGPLVNNIKGYRNYYLNHADNWEIQALIKARPASTSREGLCGFMNMRRNVLEKRAKGVSREDILNMRRRIMTELIKPGGGIDIKLDQGGIEEIEFLVQYLQLKNVNETDVHYQDTLSAIRSLKKIKKYDIKDLEVLADSYMIFRTIESYLRLSMKNRIREDEKEVAYLSKFMGFDGVDELLSVLNERM
ncbi:MAG: bifunctional [glutamate--ammonia ligase]-adenylyl-L-tyrosine phosphorylase/[glutamate--ammonia-ligase] adenylyltransferase, partial [Thermodesulfovibrionales bacterium]